jgi:glutamate synthase (NADPH/NADH) small chain
MTWPNWPNKLRTSSSQEEGCTRMWSIATEGFLGDDEGNLRALRCVKVEWARDDAGGWQMSEIEGSGFSLQADLALLAMGFVHPVHEGLVDGLGVELDARGNVRGDTDGPRAYHTSVEGIFAAGDMRRGQSLVVWAIREGRQAARAVDEWLMGRSDLPR